MQHSVLHQSGFIHRYKPRLINTDILKLAFSQVDHFQLQSFSPFQSHFFDAENDVEWFAGLEYVKFLCHIEPNAKDLRPFCSAKRMWASFRILNDRVFNVLRYKTGRMFSARMVSIWAMILYNPWLISLRSMSVSMMISESVTLDRCCCQPPLQISG